jgi:hypothetical protein
MLYQKYSCSFEQHNHHNNHRHSHISQDVQTKHLNFFRQKGATEDGATTVRENCVF